MYAGISRSFSSVASSSSLRVVSSVGFRDVSWERALLALPDQLLSALRVGELDDPGVLSEYPKMTKDELYVWLGEKLGEDSAPSGATSAVQLSTTSCGSGMAILSHSTVSPMTTCTTTVGGNVGRVSGDGAVSLSPPAGGGGGGWHLKLPSDSLF